MKRRSNQAPSCKTQVRIAVEVWFSAVSGTIFGRRIFRAKSFLSWGVWARAQRLGSFETAWYCAQSDGPEFWFRSSLLRKWRPKLALSAKMGKKIMFLPVAMATGGPIWLKPKRALFQPRPSLPAKFQADRPSGLGWRAVRNTHTDKQTDRQANRHRGPPLDDAVNTVQLFTVIRFRTVTQFDGSVRNIVCRANFDARPKVL